MISDNRRKQKVKSPQVKKENEMKHIIIWYSRFAGINCSPRCRMVLFKPGSSSLTRPSESAGVYRRGTLLGLAGVAGKIPHRRESAETLSAGRGEAKDFREGGELMWGSACASISSWGRCKARVEWIAVGRMRVRRRRQGAAIPNTFVRTKSGRPLAEGKKEKRKAEQWSYERWNENALLHIICSEKNRTPKGRFE